MCVCVCFLECKHMSYERGTRHVACLCLGDGVMNVCSQSWILYKKCIMGMRWTYTEQRCKVGKINVIHYWFVMQSPGHLSCGFRNRKRKCVCVSSCVCVCAAVPLGMSIKGDGIYPCLLSKASCFLSALLLFDRRKLALTLDACTLTCLCVHRHK